MKQCLRLEVESISTKNDFITKNKMEEDKNYLTNENVDGNFCDGCKYRFADLEKQEQECKTCLFYLLQED